MRVNNTTGIYKILCKISGNFYIGSSSVSIEGRWRTHVWYLKRNKHHSPALQNAWNKHGEMNFEFIILEKCDPDSCIEREQYYINNLNPEYNCSKFAGSTRGIPATEKQRETARKVHKGNKYNLGRKQSRELVERRLLSRKLSGKNKPMLNKKHSEETKRKFSLARNGVKRNRNLNYKRTPVECLNLQVCFLSISDAVFYIKNEYNIILYNSNIHMNINGTIKQTKGFIFKKI